MSQHQINAIAWQQAFAHADTFRAIIQWIKASDRILVVSHMHPDGDAVSSITAMGWMVQQFNVSLTMLDIDPLPKKFAGQWSYNQVICGKRAEAPVERFKRVIFVDCADQQRPGDLSTWIADDASIVVIDHHATNKGFGELNVVDVISASTTEVLFGLFSHSGLPFTQEFAQSIYTGLMTDTEGFRYANTTPRVLRIAAECLETGIQGHHIAEKALEQTTGTHVELLRRALNRLAFNAERDIAWVVVTVDDMEETGATFDDLEGIVNVARNIEGVEVGMLFKEMKQGSVKISLRAGDHMDVAAIAAQFNGGGHIKAAGCSFNGSLNDAIAAVTKAVQAALDQVKNHAN
jgi:bifunctional oligoribonuclease and PAP phosphatase NrnA